MPKKIIWPPSSETDFANILEYLFNEWNERVANQFIDLTNHLVNQISINPKQFPLINKKMVYENVFSQNTIHYSIAKEKILLIYLGFMTTGKTLEI